MVLPYFLGYVLSFPLCLEQLQRGNVDFRKHYAKLVLVEFSLTIVAKCNELSSRKNVGDLRDCWITGERRAEVILLEKEISIYSCHFIIDDFLDS